MSTSDHERRGGVCAVVLGGGDGSDPLARAAGVSAKALVPLAGRPLASWVLRAIRGSGRVAHCVYVGSGGERLEPRPDVHLPAGERLADSLAFGLGAALATGPHRLLLVSADLPWLRPEGVARLLDEAPDADLVYPVVREAAARAAFPTQKRTFVRLREGRVTGGNLFLLRPSAAPRLLHVVDRAYRARKNPLALAALVGPLTLAALASGRSTLGWLERRVGAALGMEARVLISEDASLAADVDAPGQLSGPALAEGGA